MNRNALKRELLESFFADECEIVGDANIDHFINGETDILRGKFGASMAIGEIMAFVALTVGFLENSIALCERFLQKKEEISIEQLMGEIKESIDIPKEINEDTLFRICTCIAEKLKSGEK